jgi:Rod binding domain-containing protein
METLSPAYYDPSIASGINELEKLRTSSAQELEIEKMKKVAKDFEAIFLRQIMKNMQDTVPDSKLFESSQMDQIQSMFWSFLADKLADDGGLGLWKNIYEEIKQNNMPQAQSLIDQEA